jgi:hypothetical protein
MKMEYDPRADAASVEVRGPIEPGDVADLEILDQDRNVRYDAQGRPVEYEFLNVKRHGVRLDDIVDPEHRQELARLFREAGFRERDWGSPRPTSKRRRAG